MKPEKPAEQEGTKVPRGEVTLMSTRRIAAVLVILATVGTVPAVPATGAGVSTDKFAFAGWIVPIENSNRAQWYFAAGSNDVHVGGDESTFALVGKGMCTKNRGKNMTRISCSGRSAALSDQKRSFTMDTAAEEATIKVRKNGETHTARWRADDVTHAGFYTAEMGCSIGAANGGGISREADVTGRLFGRKLTTSAWFTFNMMMSGAFVECSGADLFADLAAGEEITLTFVRD